MAAQGNGHEFKVGMTCGGCSGAIKRILSKVDGVASVDADHETKRVLVRGAGLTRELLEEKLTKWAAASGKSVEYVGEI